tara:strand:- start:511 stop:1746 length:1236 start_codon:yes stop_codon:yes gene_type:complete
MVLYLDKILFLTELIVNKGVTFFEVLRMMLYISPAFLALSIPMSVMVASVVTFSQFSANSELVAMKAGGFSFLKLMKPVLLFSIMTYMVTNFIMFSALPWGNQSFKHIIFDILHNRATFEIKANVFNEDFDNLVLFAREKESNVRLRKLFIADSTTSNTPKIITAEEGLIASDMDSLKIQLKLKNGTIHDLSKKRRHYQILNFDRYDLTLDLPQSEDLQKKALKGNRELSLTELREKIIKIREEGKHPIREEVEFSKKFSIPFTCLLFGFIGAPLGVQSSRSGKSGSFAVSVIAILLYYVGLICSQNLGMMGAIPALLSVWIPNIIALYAAVYLVYKMHHEIPFKLLKFFSDTAITILESIRNWYFQNYLGMPSSGSSLRVVKASQSKVDKTAEDILKIKLKEVRVNRTTR